MEELDIPSNLRLMTSNLPYKMREKWRATAYDTYQRTNRRTRFQHLVEFIEKQAEILLDTLFGDLQQDSPSRQKVVPKAKAADHRSQKSKGSCFATTEWRMVEVQANQNGGKLTLMLRLELLHVCSVKANIA